MAKQKIDWHRAKKEFLRNRNTSLKDVASKYGTSYGYLRKISMRQGWWIQKKEFWKKVGEALDKEIQCFITEKVKQSYKTTSLKQLNNKKEANREQIGNNNHTLM